MKILLQSFLSLISTFGFAQSPDSIFHVSFNEQSGINTTTEQVSLTSLSILNNFDRPERIEGAVGNALRLDGWSTYIEASYSFTNVTNQLTVESWFATEAFSPSTDADRAPIRGAAIVSQINSSSGFSLGVESYGTVYLDFFVDGTKYEIETSDRIEKYKWNHIVGVIDLTSNSASIYLNGILSFSQSLNNELAIDLNSDLFYIARHSEEALIAGINLQVLNGALDEIKVFNDVLTPADILQRHQMDLPEGDPDLFVDQYVRHEGDYLRPQYHPMPTTSWTNEAYGLTYHNDKYHLFYQKNPNAPILHFMHWGHLSSPDLVNWTEEKLALAPDPGWDNFGIWSGTTISNQNDEPVIFYTGVNTAEAGMGIAYPTDTDLINWEKEQANPVIDNPPSGFSDFRDPFVWKDGDTYYMIIGSARGGTGALPTYKSTDLINWTTIATLLDGSDPDEIGFYWEMPYFIKLNDDNEYLLGVGPLFASKNAEAIYWIGTWEDERFIPHFDEPKQLEFARNHMLAPAFGRDEEGRIVYIGIVPDTRSEESQIAAGWRQTFTLPRVVRLLQDSTIGTYAHPNLCRYRTNEVFVEDREIDVGSDFNLPEFGGNQIELLFKVLAEDSAKFSVQVLKSDDGSELTAIDFDLEDNSILADLRNASSESAGANAKRGDYVFDYQDTIFVHVYVDHSIVEVFVDNTIAYSGRVYPDEMSLSVDLIAQERSVTLAEAYQWDMMGLGSSSGNEVCEPTYLPVELRDPPMDTEPPLGVVEKLNFEIYPNPASEEIVLKLDQNLSTEGVIKLVNLSGRTIRVIRIKSKGLYKIRTSDLQDGIYFMKVESERDSVTQKMIIRKN